MRTMYKYSLNHQMIYMVFEMFKKYIKKKKKY